MQESFAPHLVLPPPLPPAGEGWGEGMARVARRATTPSPARGRGLGEDRA